MSIIDERSFDRLLWAYPQDWRRRNGAAIVGTALDVAEQEGRNRPTLAEWLNLSANGMGTTMAGWIPGSIRDAIAQGALGTGVAFALTFFWFHGWWPSSQAASLQQYSFVGPFTNPGVVICALWVLAVILSMTTRHAAARVSLALAIAIGLVLPIVNQWVPAWDGPSSITLFAFNVLAALAMIGTPRSRLNVAAAAIVTGIPLTIARLAVDIRPGTHDRHFWTSATNPEILGWLLALILIVAVASTLAGHRRVGAGIAALAAPWFPIFAARAAMWDAALGVTITAALITITLIGLTLHLAGIRVVRTRERHPGR